MLEVDFFAGRATETEAWKHSMAEARTIFQKWIGFSMKAAGVLLMGMLFVFYFTLLVPVALIFRALSDPLRLSPQSTAPDGSFFVPRKRAIETRESSSNPF